MIIQKEVAERIAKDKKMSLLSLSVRFFGEPKYIKTVSRESFSPKPKVQSAILQIKNIKKRKGDKFFSNIKTAFSQKRKVVLKKFDKKTQEKLKLLGVNEKTRAEDVDISVWEKL